MSLCTKEDDRYSLLKEVDMKYYLYFICVAVFLSSCSNKTGETASKDMSAETAKDSAKTEVAFIDSLAFWTNDEIVKEHGDLVNLTQYLWLKARDAQCGVAERLKQVAHFNPQLVEYYDKHHKELNLSSEQKVDSVLNEILAVYEPMSSGSTMEMLVALDVDIAVAKYREAVLLERMQHRAKSETLCAALQKEMKLWSAFENEYASYLANVSGLLLFGGSASAPASMSSYLSVLEARIDDMNRVENFLLEGQASTRGVSLGNAKRVFEQSIKQSLDSVYFAEYNTDSMYVAKYQKVKVSQKDVNKLLSSWLRARAELGKTTNLPEHAGEKDWPRLSSFFLIRLSELAVDAATF